ncbi:hypothetical protein FPT15_16185 [Pseudomonas sp. RGB]|nr:hypothetical protein FPT15_16185 [Pseudomonas sp. RGB]
MPAMQAPRHIRHNQLMPSQASQLPHLTEYTRLPDVLSSKCGSGLAREYGGPVIYKPTDTPPSGASPLPHWICADHWK